MPGGVAGRGHHRQVARRLDRARGHGKTRIGGRLLLQIARILLPGGGRRRDEPVGGRRLRTPGGNLRRRNRHFDPSRRTRKRPRLRTLGKARNGGRGSVLEPDGHLRLPRCGDRASVHRKTRVGGRLLFWIRRVRQPGGGRRRETPIDRRRLRTLKRSLRRRNAHLDAGGVTRKRPRLRSRGKILVGGRGRVLEPDGHLRLPRCGDRASGHGEKRLRHGRLLWPGRRIGWQGSVVGPDRRLRLERSDLNLIGPRGR